MFYLLRTVAKVQPKEKGNIVVGHVQQDKSSEVDNEQRTDYS